MFAVTLSLSLSLSLSFPYLSLSSPHSLCRTFRVFLCLCYNVSISLAPLTQVVTDTASRKQQTFHCNAAVDGAVDQEAFFVHSGVVALLHKAIQGLHTTVFAYGQVCCAAVCCPSAPSWV